MKKVLLVFLCVCLCGTMFIGCEKEEEVEPVVTETAQTIILSTSNFSNYLTYTLSFGEPVELYTIDNTTTYTCSGLLTISRTGNYTFSGCSGYIDISVSLWEPLYNLKYTLTYDGLAVVPFTLNMETSAFYIHNPSTGDVNIDVSKGSTVIING